MDTVSHCEELWGAISENDLKDVQKILFSGGNIDLNEPYEVNVYSNYRYYRSRNNTTETRIETEKTTFLLHACLVSSPVLVSALVKAGANVNDSGNVMSKQSIDKNTRQQIYSRQYNATPLILAVMERNVELVKKLLHRCGADVNATNDEGLAPLHFIVQYSSWGLLREYRKIKCPTSTSSTESTCSEEDLQQIASLLLTAGAAVDLTDKQGRTPLYFAVHEKDVATTQLLLQHRARADIPDSNGKTPLHIAAMNCDTEMCKILLSEDGSSTIVNLAANDGTTSLHDLIETMLYFVEDKGTIILKLFIEKGADLTAQNHGLTPLHLAAQNNLLLVVKLLVEAGADIHAETPNTGLTPLDMAEHGGNQDIIDYLTTRQDACDREKNKREEPSVEQEDEEDKEESQKADTPVEDILELEGAVGGFEQMLVIKEEGDPIEE